MQNVRKSRSWILFAVGLTALVSVSASNALGEIMLFHEDPKESEQEEVSGESRFGSQPKKPQLAASRAHRPGVAGREEEETTSWRGLASDTGGKGDSSETMPRRSLSEGVQEIGLIAGDLGYFPKTLFVAPGIEVKLFVTGASKRPLCLMMDDFKVRRQIRSQRIEEISFTPKAPGQYRFYCPVNGIEGTLLVKERNVIDSALGRGAQHMAGAEE